MPLKPKAERLAAAAKRCGGQPCNQPAQTQRSTTPMPGLVKRGARYGKAVAVWTAAGAPTRSQAEIDERLAICQACPEYSPEHSACKLCGCNINAQANGLKNKLAMATEKCPAKPPRWS